MKCSFRFILLRFIFLPAAGSRGTELWRRRRRRSAVFGGGPPLPRPAVPARLQRGLLRGLRDGGKGPLHPQVRCDLPCRSIHANTDNKFCLLDYILLTLANHGRLEEYT